MESAILGLFIILALSGFSILLREIKHRSVPSFLSLRLESSERSEDLHSPKHFAYLGRSVSFPVTPMPGMEIQDWGVDGVVIQRVLIAEDGIKVFSYLRCVGRDIDSEVQRLEENGWHREL